MGTTADKLQAIINSKNAIKTAINNKGGSIADSTPLDEYATAIDSLSSGSQITFYNPNITRIRKRTKGDVQGGAQNTIYSVGNPNLIPVKKAYILKFDGTLEELPINNNYAGYRYYDVNDEITTEFSYTNVDGQNYISISKFVDSNTYWGYDINKNGVYVIELDENKCEFLNYGTYIGIDIGSNITSTSITKYETLTTTENVSLTFTGCWSGGYISNQSAINKHILIPNFINW